MYSPTMNQSHWICLQSWVPVRASRSATSEMVSSLIFGETCVVLSDDDGWLQVRTGHDNYPGFISKSNLLPLDGYKDLLWQLVVEPFSYLRHQSKVILLSPGSRIPSNGLITIEGEEYQWVSGLNGRRVTDLFTQAKWFLNAPYLWGGRSIYGIDCSGFIQVLGKMSGLQMPRDASQQAMVGLRKLWQNRTPGDLCYFENEGGRITHVGLLLPDDQIIHASGKVRIDMVTPKGIIHNQTQQLTHKLSDIRSWS